MNSIALAYQATHLDGSPIVTLHAVGGTASSYAIRSKAAVLLALVTKRQGGHLLQALLPELIRLASEGATQAEMVSHPPETSVFSTFAAAAAAAIFVAATWIIDPDRSWYIQPYHSAGGICHVGAVSPHFDCTPVIQDGSPSFDQK